MNTRILPLMHSRRLVLHGVNADPLHSNGRKAGSAPCAETVPRYSQKHAEAAGKFYHRTIGVYNFCSLANAAYMIFVPAVSK